jgi:hypothetical protein
MKIKWGLFLFLLVSGLLLTNFLSNGQQKHKVFKAYLIIKNQNPGIKSDSLFEKKLRAQLSSVLKKKNFTLVANEEMETADQQSLYIQVNIADSLRISYWESTATQGIGTVKVIPKKDTAYQYKDGSDIIKKVISYVKKNY